MEVFINNKDDAVKLIKLIKEYLLLAIPDRLQILQNIEHQ